MARREDLNHTGSHKINNAVGQVGYSAIKGLCGTWADKSDPARQAIGQEANYCRDGSWSTRCCYRHCLCQVRYGVCHLHGCRGCPKTGVERLPNPNARWKGASNSIYASLPLHRPHADARSCQSLPERKHSKTPSTKQCENGSLVWIPPTT